jgi:short-subunit dehydrogenase
VELSGAVCLVTGATSGIGREVVIHLHRAGASVVATGRDGAALADLTRAADARTVAADLADPGDVDRLAGEAMAAFGRVDVLINNAGIGWAGSFEELPQDEAARLLRVNLAAPVRLTRALLPPMVERGRGWIVNVASIAGHVGVRDEAVYSATKAALIAFSEALRREVAAAGVGVTVLTPGVVRTAFFERRGRPYERTFPRLIDPERVAAALIRGLRSERAEVFVPWWLGGVTRFKGAAPGLFRGLVSRYG